MPDNITQLALHGHRDSDIMMQLLPCLVFMETSFVLHVLKHVSTVCILHGNCKVLLCEEDLLELDDVWVQHQAVV